jgi:hypothetical protein
MALTKPKNTPATSNNTSACPIRLLKILLGFLAGGRAPLGVRRGWEVSPEAPMTTNTIGVSTEIADLFDLDPQPIPVTNLGNVGRSADCTRRPQVDLRLAEQDLPPLGLVRTDLRQR